METERAKTPNKSPVDRIREILFDGELGKIETQLLALEDRLELYESDSYKAEAIAKALPGAIDQQVQENSETLSRSFAPVIGKAMAVQIRKDKDKIVDVLYPVIGATISKYMASALKELSDSVNQKIEQSLSLGSLLRRLQSKVTGVSEAELLFHKSLGAKFQSIFLIHQHSGTLIAEAHSKSVETKDGDMVAGMFTAINSFVEKWIDESQEIATLDSITYGNLQILFEKSGSFILAAVTQGETPKALLAPLQKLLSLIHLEFGDQFMTFSGDVSELSPKITDRLYHILSIQNAERIRAQRGYKNQRNIRLAVSMMAGLLLWISMRWYNANVGAAGVRSAIATDAYLVNSPLYVKVSGNNVVISGVVLNPIIKRRLTHLMKSRFPEYTKVSVNNVKVLDSIGAPMNTESFQ